MNSLCSGFLVGVQKVKENLGKDEGKNREDRSIQQRANASEDDIEGFGGVEFKRPPNNSLCQLFLLFLGQLLVFRGRRGSGGNLSGLLVCIYDLGSWGLVLLGGAFGAGNLLELNKLLVERLVTCSRGKERPLRSEERKR